MKLINIVSLLLASSLLVHFELSITRKTATPEHPGPVTYFNDIWLDPGDPARDSLAEMLSGVTPKGTNNVTFAHILPRFIKIQSRGLAKPVPSLMSKFVYTLYNKNKIFNTSF